MTAMTADQIAWWIVLLPGENPEVYGPFRSEHAAQTIADKWNRDADCDDQAQVMPILPKSQIEGTR